jgi:hypothetical protein
MTRKLLMTAAIVAIALTPLISIDAAQAHGGGFGGGGFNGGGFHGGFHGRGFDGRGFFNGGLFRRIRWFRPGLLWKWKLLSDRLWCHLLLLITGHLPSKNLVSSGSKLKSPAIPAGLFVP